MLITVIILGQIAIVAIWMLIGYMLGRRIGGRCANTANNNARDKISLCEATWLCGRSKRSVICTDSDACEYKRETSPIA